MISQQQKIKLSASDSRLVQNSRLFVHVCFILCKRGMLLAEIIMLTGIVFHRPSVFLIGVIANKILFLGFRNCLKITYLPCQKSERNPPSTHSLASLLSIVPNCKNNNNIFHCKK
jgi:hypothetical protein